MNIKTFFFLTFLMNPTFGLACGSQGQLTDTDIELSSEIEAIFDGLVAKFPDQGQDGFQIDEIIRSGNDHLNLDKKIVASEKCAAQLHYVFIESAQDPGFLCNVAFQPTNRNGIKKDGDEFRIACRTAPDARPQLVLIPWDTL